MSEQDIQKYEKMLEEDPHSRAFAPLAEAHRKAGNLEDAIRVAEAGLEVHPGYTGGLVVLGRALYEKRELDKAVEVLKKAVMETPESYLGQKFLGKVLMEKGEHQAALAALEAAYMQSPDDGEVAELLEKIRPKAEAPAAMVFSDDGAGDGSRVAGIVTYEQKPTTVDGVELEPLQLKADEETFNFSEIQEEGEALQPESTGNGDEVKEAEKDTLDALGPEAAAFIEEAEQIDDAIFSDPEDEIDQEEDSFTIEELIEEVSSEPEQAQRVPAPPEKTEPLPVEQPVSPPVPELGEVIPSAIAEDEGYEVPAQQPASQTPSLPYPGNQEVTPSTTGLLGDDAQTGYSQAAPVSEISSSPAQSTTDHSASAGEISTETLADLYARQGLVEKAVEIYRQILQEKPADQGIMIKLKELEKNAGTQPQVDTPAVTETLVQDSSSSDADDVLKVLETWLQNAERMK